MSNFNERCGVILNLFNRINPLSYISPHNYHYYYIQEAVQCYWNKCNLACILLSSATVETCLWWEYGRRDFEKYKLKTGILMRPIPEHSNYVLSKLFDYFDNSDIPLKLLIDKEEYDLFENIKNINEDKKRLQEFNKIKFISLRNKFAHGFIWKEIGLIRMEQYTRARGRVMDFPFPNPSEFEDVAFSQVFKALNFIIELQMLIRKRQIPQNNN